MICYCMSVSVTAIHWKFMTSKIKKMSVKQLIDGTTLHNLHPVHTVLLHNKKVAKNLLLGQTEAENFMFEHYSTYCSSRP